MREPRYALPRAGAVRLEVRDALGRPVALLADEAQPGGPHEVEFIAPALTVTGVYYVHLTTPEGPSVRALSLVR